MFLSVSFRSQMRPSPLPSIGTALETYWYDGDLSCSKGLTDYLHYLQTIYDVASAPEDQAAALSKGDQVGAAGICAPCSPRATEIPR